MPLKFVEHYTRSEIQSNRAVLYVFGDNFERKGLGGQAGQARGEPNAVGIATKRRPSREEDAYLTDDDYDKWVAFNVLSCAQIDSHLTRGGVVVWPTQIGMGRADLQGRAPRILNEIHAWAWSWRDRFGLA
jgi:hypothetical protein